MFITLTIWEKGNSCASEIRTIVILERDARAYGYKENLETYRRLVPLFAGIRSNLTNLPFPTFLSSFIRSNPWTHILLLELCSLLAFPSEI